MIESDPGLPVRKPTATPVVLLAALGCDAGTPSAFHRIDVDLSYGGNGKPGWVRAADLDGDGDVDLVAGGGFALFAYENDGTSARWTRHGNLDPTGRMGANGAVLLDVDGDGDADVFSAQNLGALGWWENPGGPLKTAAWPFHESHPGYGGWFVHDMLSADLDGDGEDREVVAALQEGYWEAPVRIVGLLPGSDPEKPWRALPIDGPRPGPNHCHAGLSRGDVDGDGRVDVGFADGWIEAPDEPGGNWTWRRVVTDVYGISNNLLQDLDGDGDLDLVVSGGHHGRGVFWFEAPRGPTAGAWAKHVVDPDVVHPEGLQAGDLDGDGDVDLVASELHFGEAKGEPGWGEKAHQVFVYWNVGTPTAPRWKRENVAPDGAPCHLLQLVDIDRDGRLDVIAEGAGFSSVTVLVSRVE